jgi:hypothetical protein
MIFADFFLQPHGKRLYKAVHDRRQDMVVRHHENIGADSGRSVHLQLFT